MNTVITQTIATIDGVSKFFVDTKALNNISLDIKSGEVLAVLGPNGAGKTTLINLLLGRLSVCSGQVKVFGQAPGSLELKRQCGAMLQISSLPDMLTIKEHIELFQSYYADPMEYSEVINLAGLNDIENQLSKSLSGGQKQRLLFALAICGNPGLLFLDEPSVGLDVSARKSLWKAIKQLKSQGTSIVLTTHYLEEADQLSDRIVMLNRGRIIHQGTPEIIKARVNFKKVIFKSQISQEKLSDLSAVKEVESLGNFYHLQTTDAVATLKDLFSIEADISELTVSAAALEDAFIQLNNQQDNVTIAA